MTDTDTSELEAPNSDLKRKALVILVPLGIIAISGLIVFFLFMNKKKPEVKKRGNPTLAVMVTEAYRDSVVLDVSVQGQSRSRTEIDLVPQVAGKITYVSPQFVAGGIFQKGDILLRIDEADYKVNVIRSEAAVARAQQVLIREKSESDIARQDWDDLGGGKEPTALTLRKPQMAEAEAGLKSAMADLENAKLQLFRTKVIAPFNGRIRDRFVDFGQFVNPGTRLARIFSTDVIEVPLSLTDADLTRLDVPIAFVAENRASAPDVTLSTIIAGERRYWQGKIVRTDSTFNPQTRALSAIADVIDPYDTGASRDGDVIYPLAPGLFVDAEIQGKTVDDAIIIPRDGLRPENKVYVVDSAGKATSRDAAVFDTNSERAVITNGLVPGELVILSPLEKSQLTLTFKALDVNNPTTVLIDPTKAKDGNTGDANTDDNTEAGSATESSAE